MPEFATILGSAPTEVGPRAPVRAQHGGAQGEAGEGQGRGRGGAGEGLGRGRSAQRAAARIASSIVGKAKSKPDSNSRPGSTR